MVQKGMVAVEERRARISRARQILMARKRTPMKKAVALLSYNLGITERKAKEYIETLLLVDGIVKKGDDILRK